ncbi:Pentatricopeptide repeat-containing protein, chloroplastic [Ananas comosus]|uniref:Pentatricopeptide repeat-containing protein, chloroplastic n=1 Tax=Ananas comosus TaxID=4615 RepID=A0A199UVN2_ANACO|nr:Pentatricopeptide repeat-containing protein, chloroplastic [Ananas comosus]
MAGLLTHRWQWRGPGRVLRDPVVVARLLQRCARAGDAARGEQLHALLVTSAAAAATFVANHLVSMYAKCGRVDRALAVFDAMPSRNLVSFSALVSGLAQNAAFARALAAFSAMLAAGEFHTQPLCRSVYSSGFNVDLFVASNLVNLYAKCGSMGEALKVFDEMPHKDEVAWTAVIDGHAKNANLSEAVSAFRDMLREGAVNADQHVLCSALSACGILNSPRLGTSLHSYVIKVGLSSDTSVRNALTGMYAKARDMESATIVVGADAACWNVVSSTSLIDGYIEMGRIEEAVRTYSESRRRCIEPNEFTFSSMIKGCAAQAALEQGAQLHAHVIKANFFKDPFVSSTLVDMYGKCGLLNFAIQLFDEITNPTDIAWNSLISALAQHGKGKDAVRAFDRLILAGIRPSYITFISLLMACSHSGLVEEGLKYFDLMKEKYGIEPREEHYSCIIDMYSRAGRLREAEEFIREMPVEPNAYGWCSLLGACRIRGNKELGELAAENLLKLEPENSGIHVLLSGIYASLGQWEDVKALRKLMRDSRVKKLPGFSWVDVNNKTHVFGSEDWSHPRKDEIYMKLEEISMKIREEGYVPDTGALSCNLEDSLKERILYHHSERIAVAFALIGVPAGKPIIVKKNLRVCADCHAAMKLISKAERREIILRDNTRFHHFAGGSCSCGDFW